jgi:hypothetical protein
MDSDRLVESYEVRLRGRLDPGRWGARLEVSDLSHEGNGTTVLRVKGFDQAALHGLLVKIRDLGLPLISVVPSTLDGDEES